MRYLALVFIFISTTICTMGKSYIKFVSQTEVSGHKFFKGEIYQLISEKKILYGKDTIDLGETKYDTIDLGKSEYNEATTGDVSIKLIKANNNSIQLFRKGNASINIEACGSPFRLLIPNYPSIVFYQNEIPKPVVEETKKPVVDEPLEDDGFLRKISWWQYIIVGILGLTLLVVIYKFALKFINKRDKYPIYKKYNGEGLTEFSKNVGVNLNKIFKYNLELLKDYDPFSKNKKDILKGKELIIGYSKVPSADNFNPPNFDPTPKSSESIPESTQPQQNTSEISSQIQRMESRILNEIESLASNKEASQKIERLQKEIESFKEKITLLNKDIKQGNKKINELNSELAQVNKKKQEIESEYSKYTEKVIFVDYLEPYAKATYDYYIFCQTGYIKALEYFQKLNHSDSELVSIVSQLLVKFNSNIPNKTNHWVGVINEIKDSKATANIDLISSLKQIQNNEEKCKEFMRILLKEVFEKYSSSILILAEELSNLSKFTNDNAAIVNDFEQFFTSFKSELQIKSKSIDLDFHYVPLFEHYEKYAAFTKLANQMCSLPYKNIKNITKDSVLEIINYGFGNEETNVILA